MFYLIIAQSNTKQTPQRAFKIFFPYLDNGKIKETKYTF